MGAAYPQAMEPGGYPAGGPVPSGQGRSHHSSSGQRAYLGGSHASRGSALHQHRASAAAISDPMMATTMTEQLASASGQLSGSGGALNQLGSAYYPGPGYPGGPADYGLARESRYDAHYSARSSRQPGYQVHPNAPMDPYYPSNQVRAEQHQSLGNLHSGRYPGQPLDYGPGAAPHPGRYGESMFEPRAGSMPAGHEAGLGAYNPLDDPLAVGASLGGLSAQPPAVYPQQASGYRAGAGVVPTGSRAEAMVAELRVRLQEAQNNYVLVKRELDTATQKLGSSMHSIKSFWSPELKKERALRKEEATKYALINDQMKLMRVEVQVSSQRELLCGASHEWPTSV